MTELDCTIENLEKAFDVLDMVTDKLEEIDVLVDVDDLLEEAMFRYQKVQHDLKKFKNYKEKQNDK